VWQLLQHVLEFIARIPVWVDGLIVLFSERRRNLWLWKRADAEVPNWQARLARLFENQVLIYECYKEDPIIENRGELVVSPAIQERAEVIRAELGQSKPPKQKQEKNEQHLVLDGSPDDWRINSPIVPAEIDWKAHRVSLPARSLDFATVKALRAEGCRVPLLSASAVLVCPDLQVLIVQQRAAHMSTYGGWIHTIGGHYELEDTDLSVTLKREVLQEIKLAVNPDSETRLLLMKELSTGFVQLAFVGVKVSKIQVQKELRPSLEGSVRVVPFHELASTLTNWTWVPTGKAAILSWLALGAPNGGAKPKFGDKSPQELFEILVGK
jgi:8-oxo-dGTP pyrophosphatase MutT (NUDIX family)